MTEHLQYLNPQRLQSVMCFINVYKTSTQFAAVDRLIIGLIMQDLKSALYILYFLVIILVHRRLFHPFCVNCGVDFF